ncbi:MAG: Rpn family recombination-promoting nuclease/putative transposase [Lachnospiraceae bacterium]|nr:Rpn family recombination-promoting nuclease/putative transposase [Lachnospiraceae bacterium]
MGKKDLWQSDYFDDKERFADMINGILFDGKPLMKAEELEETDSKLVHPMKNDEVVNVIRDKVYQWKGQCVSICVLENQSYIDYRMVFRVMLEEAISYIRQQKRAFRRWKEEHFRFSNDEFLSQMKKDEKYIPVITLVLYLGKEKWDGAKTLYEMLEIDEKLKPYVNNYKLNLFDYHEHKDFSKFRTDNRVIFELLSNAADESKTEKILKRYLDDYLLDEEAVKAIFGMLDINLDISKYKNKTTKGVGYNMCKAWDDHKERGRQEGMQEGLQKGLRAIVESLKKLSLDLENVYKVVIENDLYKDVTKEQVKEYYYAK